MAAHMVWVVVQEARAKHQHTTVSKLLSSAVQRDLHRADPHLALEVARHWAHNPDRDDDIEKLVNDMLADATSNPGYLDLDVWFHSSYRRAADARTAASQASRTRKANPKRRPADIELRPTQSLHRYRYQLVKRLPRPADVGGSAFGAQACRHDRRRRQRRVMQVRVVAVFDRQQLCR